MNWPLASWLHDAQLAPGQVSTSPKIGWRCRIGKLLNQFRLSKLSVATDAGAVEWINNRELLFALFIQGDGNFHLQQKQMAPNAFQNPSLIGDWGFWPAEDVFNEYITTRNAAVADDHKRACTPSLLSHILHEDSFSFVEQVVQYSGIKPNPPGSGGPFGDYRCICCFLPARHAPTMGSYRLS